MKVVFRLPMKEPYGYIEVERDFLTIKEAVSTYLQAVKSRDEQEGRKDDDWNNI